MKKYRVFEKNTDEYWYKNKTINSAEAYGILVETFELNPLELNNSGLCSNSRVKILDVVQYIINNGWTLVGLTNNGSDSWHFVSNDELVK